MNLVICDVCGAKMDGAVRGEAPGKNTDYVSYLNKDICVDCLEEIEGTVKKLQRGKPDYQLREAQKLYNEIVLKSCKR